MVPGPAVVRAATIADADAIAAVYRPYVEDSVISFEEVAPDASAMAARMSARPRLPWFVGTRGGSVVGYAYASQHRSRAAYRWAVDCSVYLRQDEHGHGTGRALYDELFAVLASLGYLRVYAGIALPNPASVALHESMGFTPVGVYHRVGFKRGQWHDVGWWELRLRDTALPAEPLEWEP